MKATLLFREKRIVISKKTEKIAVAEIKIWKVLESVDYPDGKKYSLFLVSEGKTVVGIDNHKPKGPHLHSGKSQETYEYVNKARLVSDFWDLVKKEGFEP